VELRYFRSGLGEIVLHALNLFVVFFDGLGGSSRGRRFGGGGGEDFVAAGAGAFERLEGVAVAALGEDEAAGEEVADYLGYGHGGHYSEDVGCCHCGL